MSLHPCGTRVYNKITKWRMNTILSMLKGAGATVTGNNPWDADANKAGVKLSGSWSEKAEQLTVTVYDSAWWAPCAKVWAEIEPLILSVQVMPEPVFEPKPVPKVDAPVGALPPLGKGSVALEVEQGSIALEVEPPPPSRVMTGLVMAGAAVLGVLTLRKLES